MTALLRSALAPNLVQTLENNPAFIHGGPFANIAHGCNSVIATRTALKLADYVVTEAGFGADLGAEKFIDIKCRKAGLNPAAAVVVATVRALKYHGGMEVADLKNENTGALGKGLVNLERHIDNVRNNYGLPCAGRDQPSRRGHRAGDPADRRALRPAERARHPGDALRRGRRAARSSSGARWCGSRPSRATFHFVYEDSETLWDKMKAIATRIYGASDITADTKVRAQIRQLQEAGYGTTRCASPRRSTPSPPTRSCAARPAATSSTSARCASPRVRNSSS